MFRTIVSIACLTLSVGALAGGLWAAGVKKQAVSAPDERPLQLPTQSLTKPLNPIEPAAVNIATPDVRPPDCGGASDVVRIRKVALCPVPPAPATTAINASIDPLPNTPRIIRYRILVESGLESEADNFASRVALVLNRSTGWTQNNVRFSHVSKGYQLTILLAEPASIDRLCRPLRTGGRLSCAIGGRAHINADRWRGGTATWGNDVQGYHHYLINHEVGHVLGLRHLDCPTPGAPAPIMLPQTRFLKGCIANGVATPQDLTRMRRALSYFGRRVASSKRVRKRTRSSRRYRRRRRASRRARIARRARISRKARLSRRASLRRKRSRRRRRR